MKLYTEEDLIKAYMDGNIDGFNHVSSLEMCLKALTPIELPSDDEIEKKAEQFYPISKEYKEKYKNNYDDFNTCWQEGADWMKEQILNQNK